MVIALLQAIEERFGEGQTETFIGIFFQLHPMHRAIGVLHLQAELLLPDQELKVDQIPRAHPIDAQQAIPRLNAQLIPDRIRFHPIDDSRCGQPDLSFCFGQDDPSRRLIPHRPLRLHCLQFASQADQATLRAAQRITPRPKKTRYPTNHQVLWFCKKRSSQAIANQETRAEETIPTSNGNAPPVAGAENASFSSTKPARLMAGMPKRNEKRAASERFQPSKRAAVRVLPDRETPGIKARVCATPTSHPSRTTTSESTRRRLPQRSASPSRRPITMETTPIDVRLRRGDSSKLGTNSLMPKPATRIGRVPQRIA